MELMTESSTAFSVSCFHFDSGASGDTEVPGAPLVRRVLVVCHWIDWMDVFKSVIHSFYDVK